MNVNLKEIIYLEAYLQMFSLVSLGNLFGNISTSFKYKMIQIQEKC